MPPLRVLIGVTGSVATIKLLELLEALKSRSNVELRKWADLLVIAPLSAHTMAKLANGLCDNLLTCVFRAWDWRDPQKRVILCPAMNTAMWENPITEYHIERINTLYQVTWVMPQSKHLACGDVGMGAMASITSIIAEMFLQ